MDNLQETFDTLRQYNMKLNPSKCAFGVSSGKFLGFLVSQRGIEANPDKIQVILSMEPPKNVKEVQSLTGQVEALNRFVFKVTDKCLPFFRVFLLLSSSKPGKELYLYLAVSPHAVSSALIREEEKVQRPVYYTSKALKGAKGWYLPMEKLVFSLVTTARKLRLCFQAYVINVLINHPLKKAMNKLEVARRLIQWAVKLSKFGIRYRPREAIKAQALADFNVEFTPAHDQQSKDHGAKDWVICVDGSSTQHAGGIGIVLQSPKGDCLEYAVQLQFQTTNNEAEYEAFL